MRTSPKRAIEDARVPRELLAEAIEASAVAAVTAFSDEGSAHLDEPYDGADPDAHDGWSPIRLRRDSVLPWVLASA